MTLFPWWAAMVVLVLLSTTTTVHAKVDVGYPSTPLTQCGGPTQLQWSGITGQPTVYVVTDANAVVVDFGEQPEDTQSVTWYPVNATAGQKLRVVVFGDDETMGSSPVLTVKGSDDDNCLAARNPTLPSFTLFSGSHTSGPASTPAPTSTSGSGSGTQSRGNSSDPSSGSSTNNTTGPTSPATSSSQTGSEDGSTTLPSSAASGTGNGATKPVCAFSCVYYGIASLLVVLS